MKKRIWRNLFLILIFAVFLGFTDNPWKLPLMETDIPVVSSLWNWMQTSEVKLGLDLKGGTQLDYEIDLRDARERNSDNIADNDVDIDALLSGVKDVIDRRVNTLGVSEPNIYLSQAGEEHHIVVELPGVENLQEAKDRVGKVVQLEFKTEKGNTVSDEEIKAIEDQANAFYEKIKDEESIDDLEDFAGDILQPNQIEFRKEEGKYMDELPVEFRDLVADMEMNVFHDGVLRAKEAGYIFNAGQYYQPEGFNVFRVTEKKKELRKDPVNAEDFSEVMSELGQASSDDYLRESDIMPSRLVSAVTTLGSGEISSVVDSGDGFYIVKLSEKIAADDSDDPKPLIRASHILFKTQATVPPKPEKELKTIPDDATEEERTKLEQENADLEQENEQIRADNSSMVAQNAETDAANEEIMKKAQVVLDQVLEDPSLFAELAKENSEDTSAEKGGDLGYADPGGYVPAFKDALLSMTKGEITPKLVESEYGYHIIQLVDTKAPEEILYQYSAIRICFEGNTHCEATITQEEAQEKADELLKRVREEDVYTVERIWFNTIPYPWEETELDGRYFKRADVAYDQQTFRPYVQVQFDDTGAELFEKITGDNVGKMIGIFVGGEFISSPVVNEKIAGGIAQITLGQTNVQVALQEANNLSQSLNAGSVPAPLKKPNELNIGATLGQESLQKSLMAGALGLLLVALFMILYYRFLGILAFLSLVVYGLFLTFVIQSEVMPLIAIAMTFVLWIAFSLRLFTAKIDGIAKALFLAFSVMGVLFVFQVLVNPIVLTLAGVAGLILSIGMAVDANILIFERMKEEFAEGKSFHTAVADGFERAWSSILDSNVSSLITCAILFSFGSSIIKGFAINLAAGIVISMFTAIAVTRTFIFVFEGTRLEKIKWLWNRK